MSAGASTAAATPAPARGAAKGETLRGKQKEKDVRMSNIIAAKAIADAIRTSLGPRGMDKMIQQADGQVLISNDGATIVSQMEVYHPAAKMLVELSKSQDIEAGDGTTSVTVIAGALLGACESLLNKGIHPTVISEAFGLAARKAEAILADMARPVDLINRQELIEVVTTSLSSKVISDYSEHLAPIAVDAVLNIIDTDTATNVDLRDIKVVTQLGGTVDDSELVDGVVFNKGFEKKAGDIAKASASSSSASGNTDGASGTSADPASAGADGANGANSTHHDAAIGSATTSTVLSNAKVALIQFALSAPKTDMENNIVISDYAAMDRILREERKYILSMVKKIKASGAQVLLIQKSILRDAVNDLSLHFLNKMGIRVITDIERTDVEYLSRTLGCLPIASIDDMSPEKLGVVGNVSEVSLSGFKCVKMTDIQARKRDTQKTMSILVRGSNNLVLAEADRSLHDALSVMRALVKKRALICGGGAPETQLSLKLSEYAQTVEGLNSFCVSAFAEALEVIPYTLAENAGLNAIEIVTELRARHSKGQKHAGINVRKGGVSEDMFQLNVLQPLLVNTSEITLATEAVRMILKIDDIVMVR